MIDLVLKTGDRQVLLWLEGVVYRWLSEHQVTEEKRRVTLHLLITEVLPGKCACAPGKSGAEAGR